MKPLRDIFWGFILLFFTINFSVGLAKVVILPPFVGYLMILLATGRLKPIAKHFRKIDFPLVALSVFSLITFVLSLMGIPIANQVDPISILLILISDGIYLWMMYLMFYGLRDVAAAAGNAEYGTQFTDLFPFYVIFRVVIGIGLLIYPTLTFLALIASFILHIVFLVRLSRFSKIPLEFTIDSDDVDPASFIE